jgi:hypothetical protein
VVGSVVDSARLLAPRRGMITARMCQMLARTMSLLPLEGPMITTDPLARRGFLATLLPLARPMITGRIRAVKQAEGLVAAPRRIDDHMPPGSVSTT